MSLQQVRESMEPSRYSSPSGLSVICVVRDASERMGLYGIATGAQMKIGIFLLGLHPLADTHWRISEEIPNLDIPLLWQG